MVENEENLGGISSELRTKFNLEEYSVRNHVDNLTKIYKEIKEDF